MVLLTAAEKGAWAEQRLGELQSVRATTLTFRVVLEMPGQDLKGSSLQQQ